MRAAYRWGILPAILKASSASETAQAAGESARGRVNTAQGRRAPAGRGAGVGVPETTKPATLVAGSGFQLEGATRSRAGLT